MPTISRFFGVKIAMILFDHNPPHFHVEYAGQKACFDIRTLGMIAGSLPVRIRAMVVEWAASHQDELYGAWQKASKGEAPEKIEPLQ